MSGVVSTPGKAQEIIRLNHSIIGLCGELGELAGTVERYVYYGQKELDRNNIYEELGDCLWYIAQACNALGFKLEDVMASNIAKLKTRYPDKYTDEMAANRDTKAEQKALIHGEINNTAVTKLVDSTGDFFKGARCEICGEAATRKIYDSSLDGRYTREVFRCKTHDRPSNIINK
jgi:NTP pyrophosphatase (non-canonical NTP hydrolase)